MAMPDTHPMTVDHTACRDVPMVTHNPDGTPTRALVELDIRNGYRIVAHLRSKGQYPWDREAIPKYMAGIKAAERWLKAAAAKGGE